MIDFEKEIEQAKMRLTALYNEYQKTLGAISFMEYWREKLKEDEKQPLKKEGE